MLACKKNNGETLTANKIVGDPHVVFIDGMYHMWFTAADRTEIAGLAYATSNDGLVWQVKEKEFSEVDLVIQTSKNLWDAPGIETAHLCIGPDGIWKMYYTGNRRSPKFYYSIGLATSIDKGNTWVRHPRPVLNGTLAWETDKEDIAGHQGVLEPNVIWDTRIKKYVMWYAAVGIFNGVKSFRICRAVSNDGITWVKNKKPVFEPTFDDSWDNTWVSHCHVVQNNGYHLFYYGFNGLDYRDNIPMQKGHFGYAYSKDGINWVGRKQLLNANDLGLWTIAGPSVIITENKIKMWFAGYFTEGSLESEIFFTEIPL